MSGSNASQVNPGYPVFGAPTTASVRQNFATTQTELTALMHRAGSIEDQIAGAGLTPPPSDGGTYGRGPGGWVRVFPWGTIDCGTY